ncbi:beta-carotene hydroxylase 2, chloroplastic-like isoform X1 [Cucurbita maxima]|uniref:beta-carotene 3-hydroxylase n=1 Tax=Cucurbita maxima TaxID=3661 RepID=A0A6J1HY20_CUCMA|nr:beta-carotene hydroxylase 2, chloroplastic-like isoform X1 [Cucurbita maxima]
MAASLSAVLGPKPFHVFLTSSNLSPKPRTPLLFPSSVFRNSRIQWKMRRKTLLTVCVLVEDQSSSSEVENLADEKLLIIVPQIPSPHVAEKLARKKSERFTYLVAAVMSSFGITSMAVMAVYYRFHWQMEGGEIPFSEMFGTFALSVGAAVGMEFWARWAHRALWHASLWHMHESHHKPREGPFELNDVFAITNAVPAIALLSYGFFHKGLVPGLCFGAVNLSLSLAIFPNLSLFHILTNHLGISANYGPWNYCVWDGLHVRPRRSRSQKIPCGSHCQRALLQKGRCCSPASSFGKVKRCSVRAVFGSKGIRGSGRPRRIGEGNQQKNKIHGQKTNQRFLINQSPEGPTIDVK